MTGAVSVLAPLMYCSRTSAGTRDQLNPFSECPRSPGCPLCDVQLVDVDRRSPLRVPEHVVVWSRCQFRCPPSTQKKLQNRPGLRTPHADLSEVTRVDWLSLLAGAIECDRASLKGVSGDRDSSGFPEHLQTASGCWLRTSIEVGAVVVLFGELAHAEFTGLEIAIART